MSDAGAVGTHRVSDIVGREIEQARIDAFRDAFPDGARSLALRGEPGIGKTTLWRYAVEASRRAGHRVLVTRPAEEERFLALGGLVDLFEEAEIDAVAFEADADPVTRGRAVLTTVRRVAEEGPVLVAIDDAQWLDSASARALRYAIRRLDAEPVGLLTTSRAGSDPDDPLAAARLLPPGRSQVLDLRPLGLNAVRGVLGRTLTSISRPALRRIYDVSEGNPLFALELARSLPEDSDPRSPPALRLPDSLQEAIVTRLETVPGELAPLLEIVSALGRTSVAELRETLPGSDVEPLLTVAVERGLLVVADDLDVRFSHPLVGSVVYERVTPLARRDLHARLAQRVVDPDLRARHLALSTDAEDPEVARLLEEAAVRAADRGAPDVAAELGGHCLRLTPATDRDARLRRALGEIAYLGSAGELGRALVLADRLVDGLEPGPRAEALVQRAQLEDDDLEAGEALLLRALDDAGDDQPLRGRVLDQLGWLRGIFRGDLPAGIACAREALAIAESVGDRGFQMSAAAGLSNMETLAGRPRRDLMAEAVAIESEIGRPALWAGPRVLLAEQLLWAGDLPAARALLEAADAEAARTSNERWRPYGLYDLASVESAAGNLEEADLLLHRAMEAARDSEDAHVESWIFYRLALVATWLGRSDEARSAAGRRLEAATKRGERPGIARARSVLGLLALSEGDAHAAAEELVEAARLLGEMGFAHPGAIPALPDGIEALALAADVDAAAALLDRLEQQAAAVGSPWSSSALERSRGVVLLARGEAARAAMCLGDVASSFEQLGFELDAARALLLQGRALLRDGRRSAAADALARARDRFAAMGAVLWAARAVEELERAAPGRSSGELTPTERRIAGLVAEGRKNREIGQALFLSVATVEAHLTRIYRKLGIRSRSELTRLVAEGTVSSLPERQRPDGARRDM